MYLGLFGPTSTIEKIDEDCFGDWIPEDMEFIHNFVHNLFRTPLQVTYEDATQFSYNIVDLMFLNDQYCHFRTAFYDVISFCKQENKPCEGGLILQNLQKNTFGLIT